jgi:putative ubiquitin-RnfH superfamily antitoxin RatB of RatAB toxin-antitoxin module
MDEITLSFCISPAAGVVHEASLQLPAGSTVQQALAAATAALPQLASAIHAAKPGMVGIWGKATDLEHVLNDGDRLEIYRPLTVDPKIARRERFARQGARSTGLFKRQRPEAKAGY